MRRKRESPGNATNHLAMRWVNRLIFLRKKCGEFTRLAVEINTLAKVILSSFTCDGRISGYYADTDTGCQVYHMCDGLGRQFSYTCPNATLFQQRMLICDHWYMVNCSRSEEDYNANSLIGQRQKPFLDDSAENPYHRTPRPDLTTHPSDQESDIIYRKGKAHSKTTLNLVGADSEKGQEDSSTSSTNEAAYAVPSHWSTEYLTDYITTLKPNYKSDKTKNYNDRIKSKPTLPLKYEKQQISAETIKSTSKTTVYATTTEKYATVPENEQIQEIQKFNTEQENIHMNFKSNFRATTPVYPKAFELPNLESDTDIGFLPPLLRNFVPPKETVSITNNSQSVNFRSNFKATTPVYPKSFDLPDSIKNTDVGLLPPVQNRVIHKSEQFSNKTETVNFYSDFEATTPVYPIPSKLPTIPKDQDIGLVPPNDDAILNKPEKEESEVFVNFQSNFKATTPAYPKAFELPRGDLSNIPSGLQPPYIAKKNDYNSDVNFVSTYNNTTPVYPQFVEPTSPLPQDVGLLPPVEINNILYSNITVPSLSVDIKPPKIQTNYNKNNSRESLPTVPSKFYQPPKFNPDYTKVNKSASESLKDLTPQLNMAILLKSLKKEHWRDLQKKLLIPDYEFPLEEISRPSYESGVSSFQVKASSRDK